MTNVKTEIKGDLLVLTVNLKERNGRSGSGKTTIVATTSGIHYLDAPFEGIGVGLNVFTKEGK